MQKGFKVKLTADGQFRLNEAATGKQIWVADSAGTGVAYAAILDTRNFVLANLKSINLWESFDQPTDTILPTQTLNQEAILFDIRKQITQEGDSSLPCNREIPAYLAT
ncbi:G-type lectin S-receptor-like serine/threonine-protein kinase LECRK3 [Prunus yedoensis var. nudiflora]|uniref:G-type lectin S-receptor-like serine/threonine-protein kinase LECRK3 n=1 Tax=Prunus yedoensis var. nudiflora TaxID=2094558 RepID=A0A314YDD1_PRUYE|nr:G-type lectin S-receptor-like serine/threonine-protein kinase LECRK3 [Prunus yedoensis var. nudiflora]